MIGLEELRYFCKIAETGSFRQAARAMNISQPGLSYTIKKLEDELGARLFIRTQKGVSLTDPGEVFLSKVTALLAGWETLSCDVTNEESERLWSLSIGSHPSVAEYAFPEFLPKLLKLFPELRLSITHGLSRDINHLVLENRLDVGLVINPVQSPELVIREIAKDSIGMWVGPDYDPQTLIFDPDLAQSQWILRKLARQKKTFRRHIESSNLEVIAGLTASGVGVGILPGRIASRRCLTLQLSGNPSYKDILCVVYKPEFRKKPVSKHLLKLLSLAFA